MNSKSSTTPRILNYDGAGDASYRQDFWEGQGREYEDRVERIAIHRLLQPAIGKRLLELGAGFGRLSSIYSGYEKVVLVDYAKSQLEDARSRLGDEKYMYVAADIYNLPFNSNTFDGAAMVRVLHHFADVPSAFAQIRGTLSDGAVFVLEYANKRNLKALLRHKLGRQAWNPDDEAPVEFVELHFDFHPSYIEKTLEAAGFQHETSLAVSYFRLGLLKRLVPTSLLVNVDARLQSSGLLYSPSIFTRNTVAGERPVELNPILFRCPSCHHAELTETNPSNDTLITNTILVCGHCGKNWSKSNGIYDFREPI